ncbi:hypothetical protein HAX54_025451, partial [Datura stramonium]|nr:hypothetical protein [Datura stramonium]
MALRFPAFSQGLAQTPLLVCIWFGIMLLHTFSRVMMILLRNVFIRIFCFSLRSISNNFSVDFRKSVSCAWQGNFESWVQDPLHVRPIAHAIWDPHFGQPAVEAFTRGGALGPVNIAYSGVYQWWYTIGL